MNFCSVGGLIAIAAACAAPVEGDLPYPGFEPDELKCDVCGEKACGVGSSTMGPMSFAYCAECNAKNREPYGALVGGLMGAGAKPENWAPWVMKVVEPSLAFVGKTLQDLSADILKAEEEYWAEMEKIGALEPTDG